MEALAHLTARVADLESRLQNILQLAKVTAIDEVANLLDVEIRGVGLTGVPYLTRRAGEFAKTYWVPEVDELGLLLSPGGDVGNAVFLPALNYDDREAGGTDKDFAIERYDDGVEVEFNGNDDEYVLRVGGAERKTTKTPAKIEDKTGNTKLTIEAAKARLENTVNAYMEVTAILANIIGAHFYPTGLTSIVTPTGNAFFAPAASPGAAPSLPLGTPTDADGNATGTPPTTTNGITIQAISNVAITLTAPVPVVTPVGPGSIVIGTRIAGTVSGTINLRFPSRTL